MQVTDTVLMIPPDHFEYNCETASTNRFQSILPYGNFRQEALDCFNQFMQKLTTHGIRVLLLKNNPHTKTPDAVFPNNWFSVQRIRNQLTLILYPMLELNRRAERQKEALLKLLDENKIRIDKMIDLTHFESENKALEGTGSIIFDHDQKKLYVSLSKRSHSDVLKKLVEEIQYEPITFRSDDREGHEIYHTNVMMSIGKQFAVICKESIRDPLERENILKTLSSANKKIIEISLEQLHQMAGNVLELHSNKNSSLLVMSTQAFQSYSKEQLQQLNELTCIIHSDLKIIETIGGGGARCMLAEIFK